MPSHGLVQGPAFTHSTVGQAVRRKLLKMFHPAIAGTPPSTRFAGGEGAGCGDEVESVVDYFVANRELKNSRDASAEPLRNK